MKRMRRRVAQAESWKTEETDVGWRLEVRNQFHTTKPNHHRDVNHVGALSLVHFETFSVKTLL